MIIINVEHYEESLVDSYFDADETVKVAELNKTYCKEQKEELKVDVEQLLEKRRTSVITKAKKSLKSEECSHPSLNKERIHGMDTGDYICQSCGKVITRDEKNS